MALTRYRYVSGWLLLCMLPWLAYASQVLTDLSKPIVRSPAEATFSLALPCNPSTGFRWLLVDYPSDLIQPVTAQVKPVSSKRIGAPTNEIWTWQLQQAAFIVPRVLTLTWVYRRPWDNERGQQKQITIITIQ